MRQRGTLFALLGVVGCIADENGIGIETGYFRRPAVTITAVVLDADSRKPLADVVGLLVEEGVGEVSRDERTDANGQLVVPGRVVVRSSRPNVLWLRRTAGRRKIDPDHGQEYIENYHTHAAEKVPIPREGRRVDLGAVLLLPDHGEFEGLFARDTRWDRGGRPLPATLGDAGLDLAWNRPFVAVETVLKGGPADRARIRVGDFVVSVDGRDTSGLGTGAVGHLLAGRVGTTVRLLVRTADGASRTVDIERAAR